MGGHALIIAHLFCEWIDYNRTIMFEASDAVARRRLALLAITLATIPCYCIGWIAIMLAPNPLDLTPSVTPTITLTLTPSLTLTPIIFTGTPTNTPTITFTPTNT